MPITGSVSKSEPMDVVGLSDAADVAAVVRPVELGVTTTGPIERRDVPWYRECPHCWPTMGGVGNASRTIAPEKTEDQIGRRYYRCDRCGLSFNREFEIGLEVETRRVVRIIRR